MTKDGSTPLNYYNKIVNKSQTIHLIKTVKSFLFGGYVNIAYKRKALSFKDNKNFIFSLDKIKVYNLNKKGLHKSNNICFGEKDIFIEFNTGFRIDNDLKLNDNEKYIIDEIMSYYDNVNDLYEINGGEKYFKVQEYEVFQILFY